MPDGQLRAELGSDPDSGCSAQVTPDGTSVTLACDPFGMHSVYTMRQSDRFWFSSDFDTLRQCAQGPRSVRTDALHGYLCFSYVPTPTTLAAGIERLPAGGRLVVSQSSNENRAASNEHVWDRRQPILEDPDEADCALREKLRAIVERQVGGCQDVGVFLSGGLDSSLVAALLAETGARVHLFALDFGAPYDVELPFAQRVAAHLDLPVHVVPAGSKEIEKELSATAAAMEQPFGDGVTVPLYLLGKAASGYSDVVFNGEFGDQLFGGWANKPMIAAEIYGETDFSRERAYMATFHRFHDNTHTLYTPDFLRATEHIDAGQWVRPALEAAHGSDLLSALRIANLLLKGAQNIAPRARQLAAAFELKVCPPFCDVDLAHWTFACPPDWLLRGACEKHLLKRAAEPYLPPEIVWREKRGMGVPTTDWCLGGLKRTIGRILNPSRLKRDGWFRPEAVRELCEGRDRTADFRSRRVGEKIWTLLMLHAWLDIHGGTGGDR
jgi:asparagine synthase (glutamine-hydrolysing)